MNYEAIWCLASKYFEKPTKWVSFNCPSHTCPLPVLPQYVLVATAALQGSFREMNAFRLFLQPITHRFSVFSVKCACCSFFFFFFLKRHFCGHYEENCCPCWCLQPVWLHHKAVIECSMSFRTCSVSFSLEMVFFKKGLMTKGSSWSSLLCCIASFLSSAPWAGKDLLYCWWLRFRRVQADCSLNRGGLCFLVWQTCSVEGAMNI